MLWVLNVGEGVEGGIAGLVGSGGILQSRLATARRWLIEWFPRRLERWFSAARHTYSTHVEAHMVFVKWTVWLRAIKDIDPVPWLLLDLGGG